MYSVRCDVSKEEDILVLFKYVKEKFGKIHVMVNNAGLAHQAPLLSGDVKVKIFCVNFEHKDTKSVLSRNCKESGKKM